MAKFDIPKFRYLFQDQGGNVFFCTEKPNITDDNEWVNGRTYKNAIMCNAENPNWRDTLIDLETDDYDFEDGILRRVEK